jgi:pilus assembly protein Flp/PilA
MYYLYNTIHLLQARLEKVAKDRGATATEYAMLVAFIAVAISFVVYKFGGDLRSFFSNLSDQIGLTGGTPKDPTK